MEEQPDRHRGGEVVDDPRVEDAPAHDGAGVGDDGRRRRLADDGGQRQGDHGGQREGRGGHAGRARTRGPVGSTDTGRHGYSLTGTASCAQPK